MVSAVQAAVESAFKATRSVAGEEITYSDGTNTATVTAIRGESLQEPAETITDGLTVPEKMVSWLILKSDLTDASVATPADGHVITDSSGQKYRVLPMNAAGLVYTWHDRQGKTIYRINSKERT